MGIHKAERERFLKLLATTGSVSLAAERAGISRSRLYHWRERDTHFAAAWREAIEIATDALEAEARRRAIEGVETTVVYGGRMVRDDSGKPLTVRRYSDSLLALLLRAHRPEKYRERLPHGSGDPEGSGARFTFRISERSPAQEVKAGGSADSRDDRL